MLGCNITPPILRSALTGAMACVSTLSLSIPEMRQFDATSPKSSAAIAGGDDVAVSGSFRLF